MTLADEFAADALFIAHDANARAPAQLKTLTKHEHAKPLTDAAGGHTCSIANQTNDADNARSSVNFAICDRNPDG